MELNQQPEESNSCRYCYDPIEESKEFCSTKCKNTYHNNLNKILKTEKDQRNTGLEKDNTLLQYKLSESEKKIEVLEKENSDLKTLIVQMNIEREKPKPEPLSAPIATQPQNQIPVQNAEPEKKKMFFWW